MRIWDEKWPCRLQSETRKRVGSRPAYVQRVSDKHKTTITNHLLSLFFGTDVHNDTLPNKKSECPHEHSDWSERRDLNPRPPPPQGGALPSCATPRNQFLYYSMEWIKNQSHFFRRWNLPKDIVNNIQFLINFILRKQIKEIKWIQEIFQEYKR